MKSNVYSLKAWWINAVRVGWLALVFVYVCGISWGVYFLVTQTLRSRPYHARVVRLRSRSSSRPQLDEFDITVDAGSTSFVSELSRDQLEAADANPDSILGSELTIYCRPKQKSGCMIDPNANTVPALVFALTIPCVIVVAYFQDKKLRRMAKAAEIDRQERRE